MGILIYLKLFRRFVQQHKKHYVVNISALTICLIAFTFIISYIQTQKSFDSFHKNADRIFRLINVRNYPTKIDKSAGCMEIAGTELKSSFSEVEEYAHCIKRGQIININGQDYKELYIYYTTPSFLKIFTFPVLEGNKTEYLVNPFSCLISETIAQKYFGNENPIGKQLNFVYEKPVIIEGVMKDVPSNSYFNFDILVSYSTIHSLGYCEGCNNKNTFILLSEKTDKNKFAAKLPDFIRKVHPNDEFIREYLLQPLKDLHLNTNYRFQIGKTTNKNILIYLGFISILILTISLFNYISLNTTISLKRLKEKGIQTISGAKSSLIFKQLLTESTVSLFISVGFALIITIIITPFLCNLFHIEIFRIPHYTIVVLTLIVLLGSGITTFIPFLIYLKVRSLGIFTLLTTQKVKAGFSRSTFIVVQNIVAILLIAFSLLTYRQYKFMVDKELGFNANNLLVVNNYLSQSSLKNPGKVFLENLLQYPEIENVGYSSYLPGSENGDVGGGFRLEGEKLEESIQVYEEFVSCNFFDLMNIQLACGNPLSSECSPSGFSDKNTWNKLLLNETAVKQFGFSNNEDIIGKKIIREDYYLGTVQGVIRDYHQKSLESPIVPTYYKNINNARYFLIKIQPENLKTGIKRIESEFKKIAPSGIFEYYFLNDHFEKQYLSYSNFLRIIILFTLLAISISAMGMFSLVRYMILIRTKEIGIRKVNGARVSEILKTLNIDMIKWIGLALIVASPLSYFAMNKWLEGFVYKTELSWWIFALAEIFSVGIALLTISWQSYQAACKNPVEALRYE